jgi:hypothetical protein
MKQMDVKKEKQPTPNGPKIIIDDIRLGVWRLKVGNTPGWILRRHFDSITSAYPLFHRLCSDIFSLSPRIFVFFFVCQFWSGIEDAVLMHLSSSLLRMVKESNHSRFIILIFQLYYRLNLELYQGILTNVEFFGPR